MGFYDKFSKSVLIGLLKGKDKQISQLEIQCDNLNKEAGELTRKLNLYREKFHAEFAVSADLTDKYNELEFENDTLREQLKVESEMKNDYYARYKKQEERIAFLESEINHINKVALEKIKECDALEKVVDKMADRLTNLIPVTIEKEN